MAVGRYGVTSVLQLGLALPYFPAQLVQDIRQRNAVVRILLVTTCRRSVHACDLRWCGYNKSGCLSAVDALEEIWNLIAILHKQILKEREAMNITLDARERVGVPQDAA